MGIKELRVGNFVTIEGLHDGDYYTVNQIGEYFINNDSVLRFKDLAGIPLTEKWIEKLGFDYTKGGGIGGQDMWAGMGVISKNGNHLFRGTPTHLYLIGYFNTQVKHVHQLQNLYFALTGKELISQS